MGSDVEGKRTYSVIGKRSLGRRKVAENVLHEIVSIIILQITEPKIYLKGLKLVVVNVYW